MTTITIDCNPLVRPSVDDLTPHLAAIVAGHVDSVDLFTAPRYRVGLRHTNGRWELVWGGEYDRVPGRSQVLRMGLDGYRFAETARDMIDNCHVG